MGDYFGGLLKTIKRKSPVNQRLTGLCCGERGIRTPGTSQYAGFQDRCIRPLCHLSKDSGCDICSLAIRYGLFIRLAYLRVQR